MTTPIGSAGLVALLAVRGRSGRALEDGRESGSPLVQLGALSFDGTVREALRSREAAPAPLSGGAEAGRGQLSAAPDLGGRGSNRSGDETDAIAREAGRTGIDPSILVALRQAENGGPGKEFGVLSVAAERLDAQARVAANTVRSTVARFEQTGERAVDSTTGRYTEPFLRFFSARYAPVGAANDPSGLNRHHAANLIALYRKASGTRG